MSDLASPEAGSAESAPSAGEGAAAATLPLVSLHRRLGADIVPLPVGAGAAQPSKPADVPMRYGSVVEEYHALREGCGLADRSWTGRLEMSGADGLRFLNAYVTCDVKGLAPGQGAYGFLTSPQGRILSDLALMALPDRLWVELPPGQEQPVIDHLRRYLIADRVEMRPLADVLPLTLAGPAAAAVLAAAALPVPPEPPAALPPAPWSHARILVAGTEVVLQRSERLGVPAWTLWVSTALAEQVWHDLAAREGVRPVGYEALEMVRTEAGIPRFGHEFGPQSFPQETGIEEAVSYTKGCYLGQEVVARIHYRGGVQKSLCGLLFEVDSGSGPPPPGTALLYEGREAGTIGTAVLSLALDRPIGLAILHRRAAAPGSRLALATSNPEVMGGEAEVSTLPFTGPSPAAG
jgi:folate-binding protein YgfZ